MSKAYFSTTFGPNISDFVVVFYYHKGSKYQKIGNEFCLICLNQFLTSVLLHKEQHIFQKNTGRNMNFSLTLS